MCNDSVEINPVFFHFADVQQLADAVSLFIHGRQNRALWSAPSPQVWTDRYNQITSKNGKVYLIYLINKKKSHQRRESLIYISIYINLLTKSSMLSNTVLSLIGELIYIYIYISIYNNLLTKWSMLTALSNWRGK